MCVYGVKSIPCEYFKMTDSRPVLLLKQGKHLWEMAASGELGVEDFDSNGKLIQSRQDELVMSIREPPQSLREEKHMRQTQKRTAACKKHVPAFSVTNSEKCSICISDDRTVLFLPCRHLVTCKKCSERVSRCPICRTCISQKMHVYF